MHQNHKQSTEKSVYAPSSQALVYAYLCDKPQIITRLTKFAYYKSVPLRTRVSLSLTQALRRIYIINFTKLA